MRFRRGDLCEKRYGPQLPKQVGVGGGFTEIRKQLLYTGSRFKRGARAEEVSQRLLDDKGPSRIRQHLSYRFRGSRAPGEVVAVQACQKIGELGTVRFACRSHSLS